MQTEPTNRETLNRRAFLGGAASLATGFATAGLATAGVLTASAAQAAVTPPLSFHDIPTLHVLNLPFRGLHVADDVKVLNYALALEDLESDLYVQALMRLTGGGANKIGTTIPGLGLMDFEPDVAYLNEFSLVEAAHRDYLRGSLNSLFSGLAIKQYKYDFGIESKSRQEVLDLVLTVEATGVQAYLGAIPFLKTQFFITAAAAIQGTEARHTAVLTEVQNLLFNGANPKPVAPLATDMNGRDATMTPDAVLSMVSPYIVK